MQNLEMKQRHLIATILLSLFLGANAFTYKDVKNWGKEYPKCNGKNQSPIIIKGHSKNEDWPKIKPDMRFTDIRKTPSNMTMTNTGHTVEIKADWSGKPPRFTGGPLHEDYVFEKITFHWAKNKNKKGAEHMAYAFGKPNWADVEMHMFFYRTDLKSFEKAESEKDGLAVIAMTLSAQLSHEECILQGLETSLNRVQSINLTAEIPPFDLVGLINDPVVSAFMFYKGSLDYPPCSESVNWLVRDNDATISQSLLNAFRKIKLAGGDVSNVRPPQALNNREVKLAYGHFDDLVSRQL